MADSDPYADWLNQQYPLSDYFDTSGTASNSLFSDLLEEDPELAYYAALGKQNLTPNQRLFYRNQFGNVRNEYLGQLGAQLQSGQAPTLKFLDFLGQMPFTERYAQLPPGLRERGISGFAPPVRYR